MSTEWIPVAGDIITPVLHRPLFVGHRRIELPPGMLFIVLYSEEPTHGRNSHNLDIYHPDFGKRPIIVDRSYWKIVNRQTKETA